MNERLKADADALWDAVMAKAGWLEKKTLNKRRAEFYYLIEHHFGHAYAALAMKGEHAQ